MKYGKAKQIKVSTEVGSQNDNLLLLRSNKERADGSKS